jgi:hypothetical protein
MAKSLAGVMMPCTEGKRLSAQFLRAVIVMRDLEKQDAPKTTAEKRERMQEVERAITTSANAKSQNMLAGVLRADRRADRQQA